MSTLSQFVGGSKPPKVLVNAYSTTGFTVQASRPDSQATNTGAKIVASGSLSAGVLTTILNVSASGVISFLAAWTTDETTKTIRVQLTIDDVVVFDSTSANTGVTLTGLTVLGANTSGGIGYEPIVFKKSCVVKIANSNPETDKIGIGYKYYTT